MENMKLTLKHQIEWHLDQKHYELACEPEAMEAYAFGYINCLYTQAIITETQYKTLTNKYAPDYKEYEKRECLKDIAPKYKTNNTRNAGRKREITDKDIAMIQMLRAQGKTYHTIEDELGISYGSVHKYSKLNK